jgi:hypothetical protein
MKNQIRKTFRGALVFCSIALATHHAVRAQAPQKMSYQAVVRDASSNLISNQSVGVQISVLQGSVMGTPVYVETHTAATNANGLVSLEVGSGSVVAGTFATIDWSTGAYYLKTETDPTGGTNYTIVGTTQLLSVPYALYSETSGNPTPGPQGPAGPAGPAGSGTEVNCSTSFNNNYVIRGTGSGNWECTNDMVITSTGRVGINATSPSSSHDLTLGTGGLLVNGSTSNSNFAGSLRIGSTSSTTYDLQVDGQTYITNGLRVGTTTSPPSNGILASGDIRSTGRFIQGSSTSGTGTAIVRTSSGELRPTSSTIRVKDNVANLSFNKDKLLSLRPVTYNLKPALGGDFEVGLIAEEVEKQVPELVVYGPERQWIGDTGIPAKDEEGNEILDWSNMVPYSVHYDRLAVYLLEIVKEQEARIQKLEALLAKPQVTEEKAEN